MKKCDYCAKEISYFEQYCDEDCHKQALNYYELCEKYGKVFAVINGICVFGIPIGIFLISFTKIVGLFTSLISCVVLGIMLLLLPFPTESMISKYKIKKAMKITRIIGLAIIGLGFMIVLLAIIV